MSSSSSESDFSDIEMYEIVIRRVIRRQRIIKARPNHFNIYDDLDFHNRFRMSKASVYIILQLIGTHIKHPTNWNSAISEENMLLITIRLYATGGMMRTIGDIFGISVSSVSRIFTIVTHHIASLRSQFINFPTTSAEREKVSKEFFEIAKLHVRIISPGGENAELYRNRKGFFSINVQTTCDAKLKITNIVARWPGSAHDSNIFQNSKLYSLIEDGKFGTNIIIADGGYKNTKSILTPLLNPTKPEEKLYNESIIRTRCTVERSYGVWKRRFPILSLGMRANLKKVQATIVATAVLHNICCNNNDNNLPNLSQDLAEAVNNVLTVPNNRNIATFNDTANNSTRNTLINNYFKNML